MCPAATESKSSNPSSKKKINKKIDSNFKNDRGEESIKNLFKTRKKSLLMMKEVLKIMMN